MRVYSPNQAIAQLDWVLFVLLCFAPVHAFREWVGSFLSQQGCLASKAEDNNGRASEQLEVLQKDLQPFIAEQIRQAADPEVPVA